MWTNYGYIVHVDLLVYHVDITVVDISHFHAFIGPIFVPFISKLLCNFVLTSAGDWKFFDNSRELYHSIHKYLA